VANVYSQKNSQVYRLRKTSAARSKRGKKLHLGTTRPQAKIAAMTMRMTMSTRVNVGDQQIAISVVKHFVTSCMANIVGNVKVEYVVNANAVVILSVVIALTNVHDNI
jgi:hypothetical protein